MDFTQDELQWIIEHVFLPPRLPQKSDPEFVRKEIALLNALVNASDSFLDMLQRMGVAQTTLKTWGYIQTMLRNMAYLHNSESFSQGIIEKLLREMSTGDVLPLHIRAQNAGVIFRKRSPHQMTFEAFEASLPTKVILQTKAKVRVSFPANPRLSFPTDPGFHKPLSNVLSYLANTEMSDAVPTTKKGGSFHQETRDTASPRYITEALAGVIRAYSSSVGHAPVETEYVHKRIDDHVLWKSALKPWRRSSLWLIVRVALQSTLNENGVVAAEGYKAFMPHFMASIVRHAIQGDPNHFTLDVLHHMNAKVARRLSKILALVDNKEYPTVGASVLVIKGFNTILEQRWVKVQEIFSSKPQWESPGPSLFHGCTTIRFVESNEYLKKVITRQSVLQEMGSSYDDEETVERLRSSCRPRSSMSAKKLPKFSETKELDISLFDIEYWIDTHLSSWKSSSSRSVKDALPVFRLIEWYRMTAEKLYEGNPERLSLMHLCVIELWVALDQLVTSWCPLLTEYSPELPESLLDPLLLPHLSQMKRLRDIQQYLRGRHEKAQLHGNLSIFANVNTNTSFAFRFFNTSLSTQLVALEDRIRESAAKKKEKKLEELEKANRRRELLMNQANQLQCTRTTGKKKNCKCPKCKLLKSARGIRIHPFEDLLPSSPNLARPIVFELECPAGFAIWRNATFDILSLAQPDDVPSFNAELYPLNEYDTVKDFFKPEYRGNGVALASSTKSIRRSHYGKGHSVPATESDVIFQHAGRFKLFHTASRKWVAPINDATIQPKCALKLEGIYETLQPYLEGTTHSPNSVLASLIHSPLDLSHREFVALGHLRSGNRLQWRNLMRAIRSQSLSFSDPSVCALVLQMIWQAGPEETTGTSEQEAVYREAHQDLLEVNFTSQVIEELNFAVASLQENWKQLLQLAVIIAISMRVLCFAPSPSVKGRALGLLLRARVLATRWMESIINFEQESSQEIQPAEVESMRQTVASIAVVLRSTYDFDNSELDNAFPKQDDAVYFLYAGSIISSFSGAWMKGMAFLVERDRRIGLKLQRHVERALRKHPSTLACLVSKEIRRPVRELGGTPLPSPAERWWHMTAIIDDGSRESSIHVDVISGAILIDGKPAQGLPQQITQHPSYKSLFLGHQFFNIRPSGISFEGSFGSSIIRFTLINDELVIHRHEGGEIEEYIPAERLADDLPACLIDGHHHWYSTSRSVIEVRPYSCRWKPDGSAYWHITLNWATAGIRGQMQRRTSDRIQSGVDVNSDLYVHLSRSLQPIEPNKRGLLVITESMDNDPSKPTIFVPKHNLTFSLDVSGQLECHSTPGYVLDTDRGGLSTLFGLQNLLCLRHGTSSSLPHKVIIPKGQITAQVGKFGHPLVTIDTSQSSGCFVYDVDTLVGRLVGSRSMESDLYATKLHAYTSSPLPDPLLQRSGTREALSRLQSASSYPSNELSLFSKQNLEDLALLTPKRSFYPKHLEVMETIIWHDSLPPTSQNRGFQPLVEEIMAFWRGLSPFHQEQGSEPAMDTADQPNQLNDRIAWRDWSIGSDPRQYDSIYHSRDSLGSSDSQKRESTAFRIAKATLSPDDGLPETPSISQDAYQWDVVRNFSWQWQDVHNWLPSEDEPSPSDAWFGLYSLCRSTVPPPLNAAVALAFLGYRGIKLNLISSLIRVAGESLFRQPQFTCPTFDVVDLRSTSQFKHSTIPGLLETVQIGFDNSTYFRLLDDTQSNDATSLAIAKGKYQGALADQINRVASEITRTWPTEISSSVIKNEPLLSLSKFDTFVKSALHQSASNYRIREFIGNVHTSLQSSRISFISTHLFQPKLPRHSISPRRLTMVTLDNLLSRRSPPFSVLATPEPPPKYSINEGNHRALPSPLSQLLGRLARYSHSSICSRYLKDLQRSAEAYKGHESRLGVDLSPTLDPQLFETSQRATLAQTTILIGEIRSKLLPHTPSEELMRLAGLWPDVNPHTLLRQLAMNKRDSTRHTWIECLVNYGTSIRDTMRFRRMLDHCLSKKDALLSAEMRWSQNWDKSKFPEWILIEIDGNFAVRDVQSDVAYKMLFPDDNQNAVMQLNMGEGKSSVIIPIVASSAASGNALVRVVVPRAQSKQQLHILRRTLTDLCNHRIFSLPFHRKLTLDRQSVADVALHLRQGVSSGSIWLCEPEQILSLRLLGIDRITNPKKVDTETGTELVRLQQWLDRTTRDILDESDEVLHARQQVIYTVGDQQDLEGSLLRWEVPQKLLGLFSTYLSMEGDRDDVFWAQWSDEKSAFPHIRCLSEEGRHIIHSFVRHSIRTDNWPIPQHLKESAIDYVTSMSPSDSIKARIESYNAQEKEEGEPNDRFMHTLLILRGLISCDILLHALKDKRWRVNYGLDLCRTRLAVPYRAKDYPSQRSEFGHPDITILLTCLSYYYGGLNDDMLERLIRRLLSSNTPDLTYAQWLQPCWNQVPPDLRTLSGINVEDKVLLEARLYPLLRFNKSTIDFYLNNIVFPRDAKEYPRKLSSSGWDLAREKQLPTTGFSGTNDARFLLPITISQMDNRAHIHTNATVISHLLLNENATVIRHPNSLTSSEVLNMAMEHPSNPTVILDVGAQILDRSNLDFVTTWLSLHKDHTKIRAAIYFDEKGNLMVLSRDGTVQTFVDSPYSERLDQCLTYLDEAHTRGTDLRLPDACAVVTLGPKLTKDKLVQGCMRMRRLGNGHHLVFFAPEEVAKLIQDGREMSEHPVKTFDVIIWAIQETWHQMHTDISSWAMQGYSFATREEGWRQIGARSHPHRVVAKLFCEPEGRTLASLYANFTHSTAPWAHIDDRRTLDGSHRQLLQRINERCEEFGDFSSHLAMIGEEKEIELIHEKEQEREIQRAPHATALEHHLFQNLVEFVKNPVQLPVRSVFLYAQDAFAGTTISNPPRGFAELFSSLYVTRDFCKVIETKHPEAMNRFMRPIEWIITPNKSPPDFMVIISPFEANALMPLFRRTTKLRLHPFAPRNNVTMRSLEDLTWFTVCSAPVTAPLPRQLVVPLNLFSGALFIRDEATYKYICAAMRLYIDPAPLPSNVEDKVTSVGFVWNDAARAELGMTGPGFTMNAVFFFRKLLRFRRHGQGFRPSHMSKVLFGERLVKSDFMGDS
ncbi:hypothetical protein FRC20_009493 [Serendipita sp. 405]|nr:hypothetical protein FRC20_009493 [Serendipita sp. 405]